MIIETYGKEAFTFQRKFDCCYNSASANKKGQEKSWEKLGISETAVENNLTFLKENGYVERVGSKKTGYWKVLE